MKFGLFKYCRKSTNLGDYFITYGMKQIYNEMGILEENIIYIDQYSMKYYKGDYVIVPMAGFFDSFPCIQWLPLSPKIIPVFFGFHCIDDKILRQMDNLKRFEPFGCRDEETMNKLRQYGIQAYLSGCVSLCNKKREYLRTQTKVFIVDIDKELEKFIPKEIQEVAEKIVHKEKLSSDVSLEQATEYEWNRALEVYRKYKDEARLIITSKMHCALPCIAMGIPVVMALDRYDSRWAGVDKILHVYTKAEYPNIDWSPQSIDIEYLKKMMINVVEKQIKAVEERYESMYDLSKFFETREKTVYFSGFKKSYLSDQIKMDFAMGRTFEKNLLELIMKRKLSETNLLIWGAGDKGKWMQNRYYQELLKFKSCTYADKSANKIGTKIGEFHVKSVDIIDNISRDDTVIIVAANKYYEGAGYEIGCELISKYGYEEGIDFFFLDVLDNSGQFTLSDYASVQTWVDAY